MKLYIVMPAYNEAENIEATVKQWYPVAEEINREGMDCKLVICNDGSKDNTFQILEKLQSIYHYVILLNKENTGHGATVLYLYRYALENGADYIFQTDSDGQTDPNEFKKFWNKREYYDLQIGNRNSRKDGISRRFVSIVLKIVIFFVFHEWVKDANTPFRLMKADKLKELITVIPNDFFLCNVAITVIAQKWNYKISWHNITFRPRQGGVNSINLKKILLIGIKSVGEFVKIGYSEKRMH